MHQRITRPALAVVACLLLGCAGNSPADLCAGVSCAPGRSCVLGICQPNGGGHNQDAGGTYLDHGAISQDGGAPSSDALAADVTAADALTADTLPPDTVAPPDQAPPPDQSVGRWYQVNKADCPIYCAGQGMTNPASSDGCRCASGEARPKSAVDQGIKFTYGTTGTGLPQVGITTKSYGKYCYQPGQKQDDDSTDLTVGCYCR